MKTKNFTRYIGTKQNKIASKNFKNFLTFFSFPNPKLQNFRQNNSCKFTKTTENKTKYLFKKDA